MHAALAACPVEATQDFLLRPTCRPAPTRSPTETLGLAEAVTASSVVVQFQAQISALAASLLDPFLARTSVRADNFVCLLRVPAELLSLYPRCILPCSGNFLWRGFLMRYRPSGYLSAGMRYQLLAHMSAG